MTEKQPNDAPRADRRALLKGLGLGAAAGVAVAAGASPALAQAKGENATERKKTRYRETEHVKKFYETNRR
jgi:hypothetical protein